MAVDEFNFIIYSRRIFNNVLEGRFKHKLKMVID